MRSLKLRSMILELVVEFRAHGIDGWQKASFVELDLWRPRDGWQNVSATRPTLNIFSRSRLTSHFEKQKVPRSVLIEDVAVVKVSDHDVCVGTVRLVPHDDSLKDIVLAEPHRKDRVAGRPRNRPVSRHVRHGCRYLETKVVRTSTGRRNDG